MGLVFSTIEGKRTKLANSLIAALVKIVVQ